MPKIGFASSDWSRSITDKRGHPVMGGAGWARLGQYFGSLENVAAIGILAHKDGIFGVRDWGGALHFDCDVIVMQRVMFEDIPEKILLAQANGQIIVNDIDDWYFGLSSKNAAFAASHPKTNPKENTIHYKTILARSDYVTTSTPYLRERLASFVKCPIELIGNYVDVGRFKGRPIEKTETPIVGWVGSTAHRSGDLNEVKGILGPMFEEGLIKLHHSGHVSQHVSFAEEIDVHPKLVTTLPLVSPSKYPELFQFDIGIVPLSDVPFNMAKSNIKGLEYAAAGIPFVASPTPSYLELKEDGIGLIARKRRYWKPLLSSLRDPEQRLLAAKTNREKVDKYDIRHGVKKMSDFFDSIL